MPVRIQRKRTKGWRMPKNTVSVTRPGKWGNPYKVIDTGDDCFNVVYVSKDFQMLIAWALSEDMAIELAIEKYKEGVNVKHAKEKLKGKNLACFCPKNKKCHADVLLKIANS